MKHFILVSLFSVFAFAKSSTLEMTDARIFAPVKGSVATAGYAVVKNNSKKPVTLAIAAVAPFKAVEMHETLEKDGRMTMQKKDQFVVEAGHTLELKPGGNHIMLFEPSREVKEDETLSVEFLVDGKSEKFDFKVISRVQKK